MNQSELLENWVLQKNSGNYHVLAEPIEVEFEFRGVFGHPPSYAYVKLRAEPAQSLLYTSEALLPEDFDAEYTRRIHDTITEALVDGLLALPNGYPYRGCHIRLLQFGWDAVGGSERAVGRATRKAMDLLREKAKWRLSDGHYRQY